MQLYNFHKISQLNIYIHGSLCIYKNCKIQWSICVSRIFKSLLDELGYNILYKLCYTENKRDHLAYVILSCANFMLKEQFHMISLLILLLRTKKFMIKKEISQMAKMNDTEVNCAFFDEN
jgi:hypothetical protein